MERESKVWNSWSSPGPPKKKRKKKKRCWYIYSTCLLVLWLCVQQNSCHDGDSVRADHERLHFCVQLREAQTQVEELQNQNKHLTIRLDRIKQSRTALGIQWPQPSFQCCYRPHGWNPHLSTSIIIILWPSDFALERWERTHSAWLGSEGEWKGALPRWNSVSLITVGRMHFFPCALLWRMDWPRVGWMNARLLCMRQRNAELGWHIEK
jgi:hypothetical protein